MNLGGGSGGLLNQRRSGTDYAYLYDANGNVEAVLNSAQAVMAAYRYDPFGTLLAKTGTFDQPFQFSTKRYDARISMAQYEYRNYLPAIGRWLTLDPLGEAGGLNLYAFVGNNPVNWVDPWGLRVINNSQSTIAIVVNKAPGLPQCIFYLKPGQDTDTELPGWDTDGVYFFDSDNVYKMYDGVTTTVNNPYTSSGLKTRAESFKTSVAQKHPILTAPFRGKTEAAGWRGKKFIDTWQWPTPSSGKSCSLIYPQENFPSCSVK